MIYWWMYVHFCEPIKNKTGWRRDQALRQEMQSRGKMGTFLYREFEAMEFPL